jgi:anti-sigma-K factor RskA
MAHDEHIPFRENIPAYALDALNAEEIAALESHLQTCASCRTELAEYRTLSDSLLTAIPPRQPSLALRQRLQGQLPGAQKTIRPRLNWSFGRAAVGIAFVFLLALNAYSILRVRSLQRQQTQLIDQIQNGQMALAMLSYPNTQRFLINEENVTGSLLLDKEYNSAVLILRGLPSITDDQTYQIWLIASNGNRTSAGLLRPQTNQPFIAEAIYSPQDLANFVGIGMTVEPSGGSDHPTGPRVFKVDF